MRLTILGNCGPYPRKDGALSGYLLNIKGKNIVLDMGCGSAVNLLKFLNYKDLDAVILTHLHFDHFTDALGICYAPLSKIPLLLPKTPENLSSLVSSIRCFSPKYIENSDFCFEIGDSKITFLKTVHPVETYAVKIFDGIKTFVYTSDTLYFEKLLEFCSGADFVLADCSQTNGTKTPHMTQAEGEKLLSVAKKVMATHIPDNFVKLSDNLMYSEYLKSYEI